MSKKVLPEEYWNIWIIWISVPLEHYYWRWDVIDSLFARIQTRIFGMEIAWGKANQQDEIFHFTSASHDVVCLLGSTWDYYDWFRIERKNDNRTILQRPCPMCEKEAQKAEEHTPLWILHDNAPVHTAAISKAAVSDAGLTIVDHPPYSPDLAPSDFWLLNHLKSICEEKCSMTTGNFVNPLNNFCHPLAQNSSTMPLWTC